MELLHPSVEITEERLQEMHAPLTVALAPGQSSAEGVGTAGGRLQVNVGGRLLEISPEGSVSAVLLRRELISLLNVSSSSSLQVMDSSGRYIVRTDEDLMSAVREQRVPLQAKLTTSALHEIEQKKREAESRKEELLNYQWQVVIEQIAVLSAEVRTATAQVQSYKDESDRNVQQFNDAEELRRAQIMQVIREEIAARETGERDLHAKVEASFGHINTERTARDVADSQLTHRIDQVASDLNSERSDRARSEEELHRLHSQLHHEFELEVQRMMEHYAHHEKAVRRLDDLQNDHNAVTRTYQARLDSIEAEAEKARAGIMSLDTSLQVQNRAVQDSAVRAADELDRARRDGGLGRGMDVHQMAKNMEIYQQSIEARLQKVREEAVDTRLSLDERASVIEQRCIKLEKEITDHHAQEHSKEQNMLDRINTALACVDNMVMAQKAADVVVETSSSQIAELEEQVRNVHDGMRERVRSDFLKPLMDGLQHSMQMQESKLGNLEREVNKRFSQEQQHRDSLRVQVHESVKKAFEKLTLKFQEMSTSDCRSRASTSPSPQRVHIARPASPPRGMEMDWPADSCIAASSSDMESNLRVPLSGPPLQRGEAGFACGQQVAASRQPSVVRISSATASDSAPLLRVASSSSSAPAVRAAAVVTPVAARNSLPTPLSVPRRIPLSGSTPPGAAVVRSVSTPRLRPQQDTPSLE
mmetsp:Transcript_15600/g.35815  ORF Transcript_15600/g.35815 Transcript_15600/m.35815 type:complete len:703 (-) Transcript_15600:56-2164(-)